MSNLVLDLYFVDLTVRCSEFDVIGDATGFLQSGIGFLNLHHYIGEYWVSRLPRCSSMSF